MPRNALPAAVLLTALLCAPAGAPADPADAPAVTLTGDIVDPGLFLRDGARSTPEQTYEALDGGQSLALLTTDGRLYVLVAERPGEDPNELVYDFVGQPVTASGRVHERGGVAGFSVERIEPLTPPAPPPLATP